MNLGLTPMPVEASVERPITVLVSGGDTIYYKTTTPVTTSDTSVAVGSAVTFTAPAWLISGGTSTLIVKELRRPVLDTVTVAALTGIADVTFTNSTSVLAHDKAVYYDGTTLVFRKSSTVTADLY